MAENQSGSAKVFMFAALILGVLATVMAFAFFQSAANVNRTPTMGVVVAAKDLLPNSILSSDDLKVIRVPRPVDGTEAALMLSRGVDASSLNALRGQRVNRFIPVGTQVNNADLSVRQLDTTPPEGYVNLSLPVRGANALSGLLVPGDYVEIFVTRPKVGPPTDGGEGMAGSKWDAGPVLPPDAAPIRVIAVGNRLSQSRSAVTSTDQYNVAGSAEGQTAVMFRVKEDQVARILSMTGAGQLPVTLVQRRPPADDPGSPAIAPQPPASTRPR